MYKTLLIIQREYVSRVKKRSFLILTLLVPLLILGMYGLIYKITTANDNITTIQVIDDSDFFTSKFKNSPNVIFQKTKLNLQQAKAVVKSSDTVFFLYIPATFSRGKESPQLFSQKKISLLTLSSIENQLNDILRYKLMADAGINTELLHQFEKKVTISAKEITPEGEKESSSGIAYGTGAASAILIYMSLFIYGAQVMRGVIEEKTNRIVEVIISSVKPLQLMMGKIIGVGMVGLTQFLLWIILSSFFMFMAGQNMKPTEGFSMLSAIQSIPYSYIMSFFITYFLGGYLLYSALFAAVGSAVDNETETQQFMFPITMPLLFTYILSFSFIINNPDSDLSFWLSMIPFTSPVAMMVRLPFGVPTWQLILSISLLFISFIVVAWVAARIYRVGILMYGKRAGYRELIKWFKYKI